MPNENGEMWKEKCTRVVYIYIDLAVDAFEWSRMRKEERFCFFSIFFHRTTRATHTHGQDPELSSFILRLYPIHVVATHSFLMFSRGNYYLHCLKYRAHTKQTYRFFLASSIRGDWKADPALKMKSSQRKEKISSLLASIESIIVIAVWTPASALIAWVFWCKQQIHQLRLTHQQKRSD